MTGSAASSVTADRLSPEARRANMRAVKGRDTKPELLVRRLLHAMGYRYRTHLRSAPGRPDLAFTRRRAVVFVHGCFWHGHDCARGRRTPKTNAAFWREKIARNRARDADILNRLDTLGWRSIVLWECALRDRDALAERLRAFLGPPRV